MNERPGEPEPASTSSYDGAEGPTLPAPTFPRAGSDATHSGNPLSGLPRPGEMLGDFHLLKVLGEGGFGRVYLARQVSLDRLVALKLSPESRHEARTLAILEHPHIVSVFLERTDPQRGLCLLCMQYVAGGTLERVLQELGKRPRSEWNGEAMLQVLDALSPRPAAFDPTEFRQREQLAEANWTAVVCRLGARLAEALAYAHSRGVLHRDVKPANILVNQYGRPLLADFNIALNQQLSVPSSFGGTLAYMAPEHLDAANPDDPTPATAVDARSDLYSLGVVLWEMATGKRPFPDPPQTGNVRTVLRELAEQRRTGPPPGSLAGVPEAVQVVLRRALAPRPEERWQSGTELAQALEGCQELEELHRELPPPGPLTRAVLRQPWAWLAVLALLPHVVGSLVNVWYNAERVIRHLNAEQHDVFMRLTVVYNSLVYPLALVAVWWLVAPILRTWRSLAAGTGDEAAAVLARRRLLALPRWALGLSFLGWLPGAILLPLGIQWLAGPLPPEGEVFEHFVYSFLISGLIALTYSALGVEFVALRALYPRFWVDAREVRRRMAEELATFGPRPQALQWLAGGIPLIAAILLTVGGPAIAGSRTFRVLVAILILLGMAGFGLALLAGNRLAGTLAILRGWPRRPRSNGRP